MRKKRGPSVFKYIAIAAVIFSASLVLSIFTRMVLVSDRRIISFSDEQAVLVADMIQGAVAAVAAGFVLYEMKVNANVVARQNDIEEAQFLLEYNQSFIQDREMCAVEQCLEQWMERHEAGDQGELTPLINAENRQRFINYLVYLEGLAPLIFRNILKLEHIDDLMAYRFFLALNNPELQEDQLFRYPEYFRGCFKLYAMWKSYRTKGGHITPLSEYALDFWPEFETYSESPVSVHRLKATDDLRKTARLIYDTDPYIYPTAFGSRWKAMRVLPGLMDEDCVFHADNIRVAKLDGAIVGIAVLVDASSHKEPPPPGPGRSGRPFMDVRARYFSAIPDAVSSIENSAHLACLCVDPARRGERVGEILLKRVIQECREKGLSAISLDVLAENPVAIRLYENYGFRRVSSELGYSYSTEAPLCWRMVLSLSGG